MYEQQENLKHLQESIQSWFLNFEKPTPFVQKLISCLWEEVKNSSQLKKKLLFICKNILKLRDDRSTCYDLLYLEAFQESVENAEDVTHFLFQFFEKEKKLCIWKDVLENLEKTLSHPFELDIEKLQNTISSFYFNCGQDLSKILTDPLSEKQQALNLGYFRKAFQKINDLFCFKAENLELPLHKHLFCLCHLGKEKGNSWPINKPIIDLKEPDIQTLKENGKTSTDTPRKSILIFTCCGGSGHISATEAMGHYASTNYHVFIANTLEETLASTDILRKMPFNLSQERLYNRLLKNEQFEWLKLIVNIGPFFIHKQKKSIERLITLEILKYQPDILISCIPIFNPMFLTVAKRMNLPLLIVPTDLDTTQFVRGMKPTMCDLNYSHYKFTLAYDNPLMRKIIETSIPKEKIHISGFPLRPSFNAPFSQETLDALCYQYEIKKDDKVILIIMGGLASLSTELYAKIFAEYEEQEVDEILDDLQYLTTQLHVICLCGKDEIPANKQMRSRIGSLIPKSRRVKIQALAATSKVSLFMTRADLLITKPGGSTSNEAVSKNLPIIFHAPFALMEWEKFNMQFYIESGLGTSLRFSSSSIPYLSFFQKLRKKSKDEILDQKKQLLPILKENLKKKSRKKNPILAEKQFGKEFLELLETLLLKNSTSTRNSSN